MSKEKGNEGTRIDIEKLIMKHSKYVMNFFWKEAYDNKTETKKGIMGT